MIWVILGFVIVIGLAVGALLYLRKGEEPRLAFNAAIAKVKRTLRDNKPTIQVVGPDGGLVPFSVKKDNPKKLAKHGIYHLELDETSIVYTIEKYTEDAVLTIPGMDEKLTLTFTEGELSGIWMGKQPMAQESVEMRQGRSSAGNVRKLLRYHLGMPGGEME